MGHNISAPLVGSHFRPPAKALIAALPVGTPLALRLEPENEYDPGAIAVWFATANLPQDEEILRELDQAAGNYGFPLDVLRSTPEYQLGYIPGTNGKISHLGTALRAALVERLAAHDAPVTEIPVTLSFDSKGMPTVVLA